MLTLDQCTKATQADAGQQWRAIVTGVKAGGDVAVAGREAAPQKPECHTKHRGSAHKQERTEPPCKPFERKGWRC